MKLTVKAALLALACTMGTSAMAQFAKPEDAIKYRKAAFTLMGAHFGRIGAMVQGKAPFDAKAAADNAAIVAQVSTLPYAGFGPGTDTGAETRAKPEIWSDTAKFNQGAKAMQEATAKLAAVAKGGSEADIKAAFGDAAKTCKGCHDQFRKD